MNLKYKDKDGKDVTDTLPEEKKESIKEKITAGISKLAAGILLFFFEAWIVKELWNYLLAEDTGITLGYWKTFGLFLLIRIITRKFKN